MMIKGTAVGIGGEHSGLHCCVRFNNRLIKIAILVAEAEGTEAAGE